MSDSLPTLGLDAPWPDGAYMLVLDMRSYGEVDDHGRVTGPAPPLPYGTLIVELLMDGTSPAPRDAGKSDEYKVPRARVPISHREDFKALYWLWHVAELGTAVANGEVDLVVNYERPRWGLLGATRPCMSIDAYDAPHWQPLLRWHMRAEGASYPVDDRPFFSHRKGAFGWPWEA